jgi:hypothetical protein
VVEKYGRIAFVPEALPLAPRPIPGELISSWLLRVSFANGLTLAQLIEAIETRFPGLSLQRAFIDDGLSPRARFAIAKFLRVPEGKVKAQELAQRFPMLPPEWILRPTEWDPGARERFAQPRASQVYILSLMSPRNDLQGANSLDSERMGIGVPDTLSQTPRSPG